MSSFENILFGLWPKKSRTERVRLFKNNPMNISKNENLLQDYRKKLAIRKFLLYFCISLSF